MWTILLANSLENSSCLLGADLMEGDFHYTGLPTSTQHCFHGLPESTLP
jgi:hypothetical protein